VGLDSLGFWYRLNQAITFVVVLIYTVAYSIIYQEAYKDYDKVTSDVRGSLVGALKTEFTASQLNHVESEDLPLYNRFWDLTKNDDFAPEMENSFFVPTNVFITTNQRRGECSEYDKTRSSCRMDSDCTEKSKLYAINNHGVRTGRCIREPSLRNGKSCEVTGWCPVEANASLPSDTVAVLEDTKHFQLEIRNHVQFSNFVLDWGIRRIFTVQEAVEEAIKNFLKCKRCQTYAYRVSDILDGNWGLQKDSNTSTNHVRKTTKAPRKNFNSLKIHSPSNRRMSKPSPSTLPTKPRETLTYHDIAMKGGVVNVNIHWDCYMGLLTHNSQEYFRKHCLPTISFDLMPSHRPGGFKDPERKGRFVHKPVHNGHGATMTRDLYKTYGIWFRFHVTSDVSRLSLMNTFKVLFVGLMMVKLSGKIFKFLAPKMCCKATLHSEEYKRARYIDIKDGQISFDDH